MQVVARQQPVSRCDACHHVGASSNFHFTQEGQLLCSKCNGKYLSVKATQSARAKEEYRRCSQCRKVLRPVVEMMRDEDDNESLFSARRVYECRCGHHFSTCSGPSLALLALFTAMGAYAAGNGLAHGDLEQVVLALAAAPAAAWLLWDVWVRHHHQRVTSAE